MIALMCADEDSRFGLRFARDGASEDVAVPLRSVDVEAQIIGSVARVRIHQRYFNAESEPIEAVYVFPTDDGAAISKFEAVVGAERVVGVVKENEKAEKDYEEALSRGQRAFLLQQVQEDVFRMQVGNLQPNSEVDVIVEYLSKVRWRAEAKRYPIVSLRRFRSIPKE